MRYIELMSHRFLASTEPPSIICQLPTNGAWILLVWHENLATPSFGCVWRKNKQQKNLTSLGFRNHFKLRKTQPEIHVHKAQNEADVLSTVKSGQFGDAGLFSGQWRLWQSEWVRPHFLACFLQMAMYSSTSSGEPIATGARWWMLSGWMSRMFS